MEESIKQISCPIKEIYCPCPEYSKEGLCDYPYMNTHTEIMAIRLWGQRILIRQRIKNEA